MTALCAVSISHVPDDTKKYALQDCSPNQSFHSDCSGIILTTEIEVDPWLSWQWRILQRLNQLLLLRHPDFDTTTVCAIVLTIIWDSGKFDIFDCFVVV